MSSTDTANKGRTRSKPVPALQEPLPTPFQDASRDSPHAEGDAFKIVLKKPNQFSHKVEPTRSATPYKLHSTPQHTH